MSETKKMHYVPRVYLEKFTEQRKGEYFICALEKQTGKIFNPKTRNICVETDLYLLEGSTKEERQMLEKYYSVLFEANYTKIYKILIDDNHNLINKADRFYIIGFVLSMFYRNNFWNSGYNKAIDKVLENAYEKTKANKKDSFFFGNQKISIADKTLEEVQKEIHEKDGQSIALNAFLAILKLTRLRFENDIITILKTEDSLVTSDNPVTIRGEQDNRMTIPFDPNNTLSIPIDEYHLLQLIPSGNKLGNKLDKLNRISKLPFVTEIFAKENNQSQYTRAKRFLLGTENGIKNFQNDPTWEQFKKTMQKKFS